MNNTYTLKVIQKWLTNHNRTQAWLAEQIGMSTALLSQVMNGNRKLQTKYIIAISKITEISLNDLIDAQRSEDSQPKIALRGALSNAESKKQITQLLWDIQHCVDLEATLREK